MEKNIFNRLRRVFFLSLFNLLFSRTNHFWAIKRCLLRLANIKCGNGCKVCGPLILGNAVSFTIGENVWLGQDFRVYGSGRCTIGDNCDIGPAVTVLSGSHEIGSNERRAGQGYHYTTTIGSGVWVGGRVTIYGNTCIGDSSIVAAGAVVNKTFPQNTMIGGVPARILKNIE